MIFKHYPSFIKTLFKFIILPVTSLGYFLKSLRIIYCAGFKHLNDISKKINLYKCFYILNNLQPVQIVSTTLILDKSLIFCNFEFELSFKIEQKNQININSLSYRILPLKQFRKVI